MFEHAKAGQRTIPVADYNAAMDAARAHAMRQSSGGGPSSRELGANEVWVRNDSGATVERFGVLGINGPVITPTDNIEQFHRGVIIRGVTPTTTHQNDGAFVVLTQPIAASKIGVGVITGLTTARVQMNVTTDKSCGAVSGNRANLVSGAGLVAQILWVESGTGIKNAIIRFGAPSRTSVKRFRVQSQPSHTHCICREADVGQPVGTLDINVRTPSPTVPLYANQFIHAIPLVGDPSYNWIKLYALEGITTGSGLKKYLQLEGPNYLIADHLRIL